MSTSELSRRLSDNPNDTMKFQLYRLDDLLSVTGDMRQVFWLVEKFLEDADAKKRQAVSDLVDIMPKLTEILKQVQAGG